MSFIASNNSKTYDQQSHKLHFFWDLREFLFKSMGKKSISADKVNEILAQAKQILEETEKHNFDALFDKFEELKSFKELIANRTQENAEKQAIDAIEKSISNGDIDEVERLLKS